MKKRILAYLLSAILVVGLVPATAWAEELPQQQVVGEQQNDAEGEENSEGDNIDDASDDANTDTVVPEGDANGEGSDDSTVDGVEDTTESTNDVTDEGFDDVTDEDANAEVVAPEEESIEQYALEDRATVEVSTEDELNTQIQAGTELIMLADDIVLENELRIDKPVTIDGGNQYTIIGYIQLQDGTLQNVTIQPNMKKFNNSFFRIGSTEQHTIKMENVTAIYDVHERAGGSASTLSGNNAEIIINNCLFTNEANNVSDILNASEWSYGIFINGQDTNGSITFTNNEFNGAFRTMLPNINGEVVIQDNKFINTVYSVADGPTSGSQAEATCITSADEDAHDFTITDNIFDNAGAFMFQRTTNVKMQDNIFKFDKFEHYIQTWNAKGTLDLANNTFEMGKNHLVSVDDTSAPIVYPEGQRVVAFYAWAHTSKDNRPPDYYTYQYAYNADGSKTYYPASEVALNAFIHPAQADHGVDAKDSVVLDSNIELKETITIDKDVTIDLNGKTITGKNVRALHVTDGTLKLTGEGTVETIGTVDPSSSVIRVGDNTVNNEPKLIIDKDVTINAPVTYGVTVFGKSNQEATINGTIKADSMPALSGNGSSGLGSTNITIGSTAVLESEESVAIYHPQNGTLNINGGTITGKGGIEAKAGTINISDDAVIKATGKPNSSPNSDGPSTGGYAVAVVNTASGYEGAPKVNITSGKVDGAVKVIDDVESPEESRKGDIDITGGTFTESVKEYVNDNLKFELQNGSGNDAEFTYYPTLDAAKEEAKEGAVITDVTVTPDAETVTVTVKYHNGEEDTISEIVKGGKIYSLDTPTKSRYRFRGWTVGDSYISFPYEVEDSVTIEAAWKKKSSSSGSSSSSQEYKVIIADNIENGKVKVDPTKAEKGDKVTITVTPNKGYEINKVYAKDADGDKLELKDKGDGEYTFTMPDSKVEVKATFVKAEEEKPAEPEEISAAEKIVLTVNEKAAMVFGNVVVNDVAPIIRNDRTMLPIRFVAKNLGAEVTWDAQFQKVSITKDDLKIEIIIGSPVAFVNGENVTLDSPAFIENSRTYLPLRFVAENLGATVLWDAKAQEVTIVPEKAAETK